jgi:cell division septum initiation protein DivIVA
MPYSPVELRHVRLGRSLFGYKRDATERLLDEVAASFEDVWRERGELTDQVDELTKQL